MNSSAPAGARPEPAILDAETKVHEAPDAHMRELRLWLRLLTCTNLIEGEIRGRLRQQAEMTLPRFDFLAQLDKLQGGMTLGEISQRMMVSNGNVTMLAERLETENLIRRSPSPTDRRATVVEMTAAGRRLFARVAADHANWVSRMMGDLRPAEMEQLMTLLGRMKASVRHSLKGEQDA